MAMDFRDLRLLVAAAKANSFGSVARSLGLDTSTVSRRIGSLEKELGLALFERDRLGVRLTPGGRAVVHRATRTLAELSSVERAGGQNGSGEIGEIRLGVSMPPLGKPIHELLTGWRKQNSNVQLTLHEMGSRALMTALTERQLDVGLVPSFAQTANLAEMPLYRARLTAALPTDHILVANRAISWANLASETILIQDWADCPSARQICLSMFGGRNRLQSHAASLQSILALVAADFGVALVTSSGTENAPPGVVFRPIDEPDAWLPMDLVWRPDLEDAAVGRFTAYMRDQVRSRRFL